ncbi:MAG: RNA polymerase sigma factor [Acidobacteriota bacterium]
MTKPKKVNRAAKEKEFEAVFNRFHQFIRMNIHKYDLIKSGIDAEDILQDIKIKLWKIFKNEKKIKNYASYIKKVVDTSVIDHIRKFRKEEGIINLEIQRKISERSVKYQQDGTENINLKKILNEALEELINSRKRVVKLFLLNMSLEDIALALGWTKDKTRNLLYRGLDDLKHSLRAKGIEYED